MASVLNTRFIVDGVPQELTPAQLLDAVCLSASADARPCATLVDESIDPPIVTSQLDPSLVDGYLEKVLSSSHTANLSFADSFTRGRIACALIDALWREGHFQLGDLVLTASWTWNFDKVGASAAFHASALAVSEYVDALGLHLLSYGCAETPDSLDVDFGVELNPVSAGEDVFDFPSRSDDPEIGPGRLRPSTVADDPDSWLVYIPFDTSEYRLGGSLLAQTLGIGGGISPQINDSDYFIDCFEVVRELVEDGIVLSGVTVGDGGLLSAVSRLCGGNCGATIDISEIVNASGESNIVRILFSEVPGVVIQIRDIDFDYVDAELLLQDVAFYPLGHPAAGTDGIRVRSSAKSKIQTILESLLQNAEGED